MKKDIETRADIDDLMNRFYGKALNDETIGYIFEIAGLDLQHHLPVIGDFWETLLLGSGNYQRHGRNPLQIHALLNLKTPLRDEHFRRWLEIFTETVDENFAGERAAFAKLRAEMIANRMLSFIGNAFAKTTAAE
jgi:hemoglobin